jgi:hypothetical protein
MSGDPDATQLLAAKLTAETAKIRWSELQRFFAQGRAVRVAPTMDLVEVGLALSRDDAAQLERWMAEGRVERVNDAEARRWIAADAWVWALVVRPWVLVQAVEDHAE